MALSAEFVTYKELRKSISDWLNRSDISDALLKDFVSLAERKIFRQLRCPLNEKKVDYTIKTTMVNSLTIPDDLLEVKDLIIDGYPYIFKPYDEWIVNKQKCTYTRLLGVWLFSPDMPAGKQASVNYYFDLSGMNNETETNKVLQTAPDLYLYASLVQAESFLINDDRIALWKEAFDTALGELNGGMNHMDYKGNLLVME